jgi:hypothetical protein
VLRTESKTKRCKQEESEFRRVQNEKQSDEKQKQQGDKI